MKTTDKMKKIIYSSARVAGFSLGLLGLQGCFFFSTQPVSGQFGPDSLVAGYQPVQNLQGSIQSKADILFVIDDSGSMAPAQDKLAAAAQGFVDNYLRAGVEVRLGVIRTSSYRLSAEYGSISGTTNTAILNSNTYVSTILEDGFDPSTISTVTSKFQNMFKVGTSGSGNERAMQSMSTWIKYNETDSSALPLLSGKRTPIILFFTDEHEQSVARDSMDRPVDYAVGPDSAYTTSGCSQTWSPFTYSIDKCISATYAKMTAQALYDRLMVRLNTLDSTREFPPVFIPVTIQKHNTLFALRKTGTYTTTFDMNAPDTYTYYARAPELEALVEIANNNGGEGSRGIDIAEPNFDLVFQSIANAIVHIGSMQLQYPANPNLPFVAKVIYQDGSEMILSPSDYTVEGSTFRFLNLGLLNSLPSTAYLWFQYTPMCLASSC